MIVKLLVHGQVRRFAVSDDTTYSRLVSIITDELKVPNVWKSALKVRVVSYS
jgi:hypothetical protein